jgi:hypothetical protein
MERMMGLEPTTFCMARLVGRGTGAANPHGYNVGERDVSRPLPSVPVACYHGVTTEASLQRSPQPRGLLICAKQVGVDAQRDGRVGVPELPGDEDDIGTLADEDARVKSP